MFCDVSLTPIEQLSHPTLSQHRMPSLHRIHPNSNEDFITPYRSKSKNFGFENGYV